MFNFTTSPCNSNTQAGFPIRSEFNKVNYNQLSQQATTHVSRGCHAALIIGCITVTPSATLRFSRLMFHVENKGTNQCQCYNTQVYRKWHWLYIHFPNKSRHINGLEHENALLGIMVHLTSLLMAGWGLNWKGYGGNRLQYLFRPLSRCILEVLRRAMQNSVLINDATRTKFET